MKYLITRTDDFGSAKAANAAILKAVSKGTYVKNVSCMAAAPCVETDAAELERLRQQHGFCIGLHATINSEWEKVHFTSVLPAAEVPTLVDEQGIFAMHPMLFSRKMPDVGEAIREISAQLDRLTALGLTVEYVDSHMLPEAAVPGLMEELSGFAKRKGLIDQRAYYTFPVLHQPMLTGEHTLEEDAGEYRRWYESLENEKQYINILHPACYSEETRLFYNNVLKGDTTAKSRDAEQRLLNSGRMEQMCEELEILPLKYTEAVPQGDTTLDAVKNF